ncbi:MAG: DUF6603 domain-containing protein [Polyangiaceae bacterium]
MADDTQDSIARELLAAIAPQREGFSSADRFKGLLYNLGWSVTGIPSQYLEAGAQVAAATEVVEQMAEGPFEASQVGELLGHVVAIYEDLNPLPALPPGMDPGAALEQVGKNLSDLLITQYLARRWPIIHAAFSATEVIQIASLPGTATQRGFARAVVNWEQIPTLLQDPHLILQRVYGWGTDQLDMDRITQHLAWLLLGIGFPVVILEPNQELLRAYSSDGTGPRGPGGSGLKWPFYYTTIAGAPVELSVQLLPLPARGSLQPGLVIQPGFPAVLPLEIQLSDETKLELKVGSDIAQQFGILIRPSGLGVKYPFMDATTVPSVTFGAAFSFEPAEPVLIFGKSDGIRLQTQGFTGGFEATGPVDDIEFKVSFDVHQLSLVLAASEGDGFLHELLGDGETKIDVPLGIDWSSKHGFGFRGSMNLEIALHPHLKLGPVEIPDLSLSLGIAADDPHKLKIEVALTLNAALGPLQVSVEQMGIGVYARFGSGGNLGVLDLSLGFKPPKGAGLSIDAGAVRGGGYLFFDSDNQEYGGVVQLSILDMISVTAIGLISTKMPDGSAGFSLLVILSVEFNPGIQLGMGFSLVGLGGILGLNRTMLLEPLMLGVRNGTLNSILFPEGDIIANAPQIISDLRAIFPVYVGKFLIGPMAKLGWGTPTLVSVSLGVIIEIPGNIAILGVLRLNLPTPDAPLVVIQVAFAGAIEFDKKRLFFFASLFESRILFITLEGEMGLLLGWGDEPAFVFTIGGFHPRFTPPPLPFPSPNRLALCILNEDNALVRIEAYFAVTSNTVQLGAHVELRFGFDSFGIQGHLGFDALFQFSPFYFSIEVDISLSLRALGMDLLSVRVDLGLEGPNPWHAHGTGHISLLFFEISADFDVTWGDSADTTLPPLPIIPLFAAEYDKTENWTAALPPNNNLLVSLRGQDSEPGTLVLHPLGTLRFSQRALPLGIRLDKVGTQKPSDANRFDLSVTSASVSKSGDAREKFALAQFQNMDDSEKLSRPSFESGVSGVEMKADSDLRCDHLARRVVRYEEILIDSEYKNHRRVQKPPRGLFVHELKLGAASLSELSQGRREALGSYGRSGVVVPGEAFVVAHSDTNQAYGAAGEFQSSSEAREHLAQVLALDPGLAGKLQVIPAHEAA